MFRVSNALLLVALVLPYARSPLCNAGQHAHDHISNHRALDAADHSGHGGTGCHSLMGCNVVIEGTPAADEGLARITPGLAADRSILRSPHDEYPHPPLPPPPRGN